MTAVLIALELFTIYIQRMVCNKLCHRKKEKKLQEVIVWLGFWSLASVMTYVYISSILNVLIYIGLFWGTLEILYQDSHRKKILLTLFMYILGMSSEVLVYQGCWLFGIDNRMLLVLGDLRLWSVIVSKLIWFMGIWVAMLIWKHYQRIEVSPIDWGAAVFIPVSSIVIAVAMIDLDVSSRSWLKLVSALLLVLINFLTFYLFDRVSENAMNRAEQEYVKKQSRYYARMSEEMGKYWLDMRCFRHDLKQRYLLEQYYLEKEDYERLRECYKESLSMLKKGETVAKSGNPCIDNIINYKAVLAKQKGIEMQAELLVGYDMELEDEDICSLLGNLLDNAIEATEQVDEEPRRIKVRVKASGQNILICTENPYKEEGIRKNGGYLTTKPDKGNHGFGLKIIENIAAKYKGEVVIEEKQNFVVKVLLYNIGI